MIKEIKAIHDLLKNNIKNILVSQLCGVTVQANVAQW